jgi:hypothetical protein
MKDRKILIGFAIHITKLLLKKPDGKLAHHQLFASAFTTAQNLIGFCTHGTTDAI